MKILNLAYPHEANWLPSIVDDICKTNWMGGICNVNRIGSNIPAESIRENKDYFSVEIAELDIIIEDFNIELDQNILTISSEEKKEIESND